jgi:phosphomevalonate kinase
LLINVATLSSAIDCAEKLQKTMNTDLYTVMRTVQSLLAVDGEVVVAKTGMGSSAALITSLVGCLLNTFNVVKLPSRIIDCTTSSSSSSTDCSSDVRSGMRIVHNLAQVCHAAAQGKIGSGFDVSSAVYGSHVYTRFSPQIIAPLLSAAARDNSAIAKLHKIVAHTEWDCIREPAALPTTFRLLMGDVQGGSSTPAMVSSLVIVSYVYVIVNAKKLMRLSCEICSTCTSLEAVQQ